MSCTCAAHEMITSDLEYRLFAAQTTFTGLPVFLESTCGFHREVRERLPANPPPTASHHRHVFLLQGPWPVRSGVPRSLWSCDAPRLPTCFRLDIPPSAGRCGSIDAFSTRGAYTSASTDFSNLCESLSRSTGCRAANFSRLRIRFSCALSCRQAEVQSCAALFPRSAAVSGPGIADQAGSGSTATAAERRKPDRSLNASSFRPVCGFHATTLQSRLGRRRTSPQTLWGCCREPVDRATLDIQHPLPCLVSLSVAGWPGTYLSSRSLAVPFPMCATRCEASASHLLFRELPSSPLAAPRARRSQFLLRLVRHHRRIVLHSAWPLTAPLAPLPRALISISRAVAPDSTLPKVSKSSALMRDVGIMVAVVFSRRRFACTIFTRDQSASALSATCCQGRPGFPLSPFRSGGDGL